MIEYRCPLCHELFPAPNVLRCPYCNKDLRDCTDALSQKHIAKCAYYLNPYQYSDRPTGRPPKSAYKRPE